VLLSIDWCGGVAQRDPWRFAAHGGVFITGQYSTITCAWTLILFGLILSFDASLEGLHGSLMTDPFIPYARGKSILMEEIMFILFYWSGKCVISSL
jgi:hypothetical protein